MGAHFGDFIIGKLLSYLVIFGLGGRVMVRAYCTCSRWGKWGAY